MMENETMEVVEKQNMSITEGMKADLLTTVKWGKFLVILGWIGMVLLGFVCLILLLLGMFMQGGSPDLMGMGCAYIVIIALYIYPLLRAGTFCGAIKAACQKDDQDSLSAGFKAQRQLLKYVGMLSIVALVIYALALFGVMLVALLD